MAENLEKEVFGTTKDGETVHRVEIKGGGLTAKIMTWGAVIQDLRLDGHDAPLLLGFDDFADYPAYSSYFGADARTLRQPHRRRQVHAGRQGLSVGAQRKGRLASARRQR